MRIGIISNEAFWEMYWRVYNHLCSTAVRYWANYISSPSPKLFPNYMEARDKYHRLRNIIETREELSGWRRKRDGK